MNSSDYSSGTLDRTEAWDGESFTGSRTANSTRQPAPRNLRQRLSERTEWGIGLGEVFSLFAGLVSFLEVPLVGRVFATEICLFCYLIFSIQKRGRQLGTALPWKFLVLAAVWLLGQMLTDTIRGTEPEDYLKGWARIIFTMLDFSALYLLLRKPIRFPLYLFGLGIGLLAKYFVDPDEKVATDPWKWGLAFPTVYILVAAASIAYDKKSQVLALLALSCGVLLNLYFNFRSFALICFVTLCVAAFKIFNYRKLLSPRKVALMSLALGLGLVCFQQGYVFAVTRGWLGADALGKYENQAHGDLGMLLGGRSEAFSSVQAVRDSPIIGHGSYAKDQHYVDLMLEAIVAHGYTTGDVETEGIPTHSHLMGAWVEAGILGAIFWGWVFFLAAKGLLITIGKSRELLPLTVFSGTILLWDILFSPYADMRRFTTTFFVIAMMRAISVASAIQPEGRRVAGSGNGRLSSVRAADLAVTN